jgi:hypothetical protein
VAHRVSSILKKEKGITNLVFDTCGVGYFEARKGYAPAIADLNLLLQKNREKTVKIATLALVDVPKAQIVYELGVKGLG